MKSQSIRAMIRWEVTSYSRLFVAAWQRAISRWFKSMTIRKQFQCSLLKSACTMALSCFDSKDSNCSETTLFNEASSRCLNPLASQPLIYGLTSAFWRASCSRWRKWVSYDGQGDSTNPSSPYSLFFFSPLSLSLSLPGAARGIQNPAASEKTTDQETVCWQMESLWDAYFSTRRSTTATRRPLKRHDWLRKRSWTYTQIQPKRKACKQFKFELKDRLSCNFCIGSACPQHTIAGLRLWMELADG